MSEEPQKPKPNRSKPMEFDLGLEGSVTPRKESKGWTPPPPPVAPRSSTPPPEPQASTSAPKPETPAPLISTPSTPTEKPTMNPSPSMSDFRRNTERQAREQETMGSLLSGVAYALVGGILLVAILASFGGYVLWKQIQNNATTVAQLDEKYSREVQTLQDSSKALADQLDAISRKQQEQVNRLAASVDAQRSEIKSDRQNRDRQISTLQQRVKRLEDQRTIR